MRSFKGAAAGPVALAARSRAGRESRPRPRSRAPSTAPLRASRPRRVSAHGKGACRRAPPASLDQADQALDRVEPRGGDCRACLGHLLLEPLEQRGASPRAAGTGGSAAASPGRSGRAACASWDRRPSTSRSRKRRRSDADPVNSPSIAGISQTSLTCSASAPALIVLAGDAHGAAGGLARACRRARPVPISTSSWRDTTVAATAKPPAPVLAARARL